MLCIHYTPGNIGLGRFAINFYEGFGIFVTFNLFFCQLGNIVTQRSRLTDMMICLIQDQSKNYSASEI